MKRNTFSKDTESGKSAAIYCRVSTGEQDTTRQERDLLAFAERAGFSVVRIFHETASGIKHDRPIRAELMKLAQARKIDAILVTELTRWGRSTIDLLETLQELNAYNVSVIAERGDQFDLSTAQGKMIAGVLAVLAQFERDLISERTKSGLELARSRGKRLGRPRGNKTDDKHRAAILELKSHNMSIRMIATKLRVSKDTVQRVINNTFSGAQYS